MSNEIKDYFISQKLNIRKFKEEHDDSLKTKVTIIAPIINIFIKNVSYLFFALLSINILYQNEFYSFNKLFKSYEFNAFFLLSLIIFVAIISTKNDLRRLSFINDFYLYLFCIAYFYFRFNKINNLHLLLLIIDLMFVASNKIKKFSVNEKRREERLLLFHWEVAAK